MVRKQATTLLHPAAEDVAQQQRLAPRLSDLQGMTIGLIDNHKRNADVFLAELGRVFLAELGRVFQEEYGVSKVVSYKKASQSMPTPDEVMDQLADECDAIVHAVAD